METVWTVVLLFSVLSAFCAALWLTGRLLAWAWVRLRLWNDDRKRRAVLGDLSTEDAIEHKPNRLQRRRARAIGTRRTRRGKRVVERPRKPKRRRARHTTGSLATRQRSNRQLLSRRLPLSRGQIAARSMRARKAVAHA